MVNLSIDLYTQMLEYALPVAIVFELCNLIVGTFIRTAFGGRLWLGK